MGSIIGSKLAGDIEVGFETSVVRVGRNQDGRAIAVGRLHMMPAIRIYGQVAESRDVLDVARSYDAEFPGRVTYWESREVGAKNSKRYISLAEYLRLPEASFLSD